MKNKFASSNKKKAKKQPKVAIIITTFNQDKLLEKNLKTLEKKTDHGNYRVYLVDDSGKGKIGTKIKNDFKFVNVTINKKNLGFSKANNIGLKKAIKGFNPDYFLLLNDDTEVQQKNWLKKMVEEGEKDAKTGIIGGKILYLDKTLQNIGGYMRKWEIAKELKDRKDVFEVDHVMGAFMLIKKAVIEEIGFLDEIYSPFLLEDTDYCLRAKRAGFKVKSIGQVKIVHHKGKSVDSLKNKRILFVRFKNDIIFSFRNLSLKDALLRVFVYLPMVAIFRKTSDEADLKMKNFVLRKNFLINLALYFVSLIYTPIKFIFRK